METFVIKDYFVISHLGQGGMAKVYLAEHKSLGHKVAIKVLNKEFFHNANIRKRFLAEARSLAGMNHPNIVRVTDLIEENESAAFVMEHIDGRTLREYLEEKGKLPDAEIKHLFGQMLDAVGYVHEQGLIHRDIKPSNFMLDGRGNIKLLDFGIAKATDTASAEYTQTGTGVQMGTPMYMSPEQIMATNSVTPQSDIYSLGVVLWQMVTGSKPYDTKTLSISEIEEKIRKEAIPKTQTHWDGLISKVTNKKPELRPKNVREISLVIFNNEIKPSNYYKKWNPKYLIVIGLIFVIVILGFYLKIFNSENSKTQPIEINGWNDDVVSKIYNRCIETDAARFSFSDPEKQCDCIVKKITSKYPDPKQFENMELGEYGQMVAECQGIDMTTSVIWPESTQQAFIDSCTSMARTQGMPDPVGHCNCILKGIMTTYPTNDSLEKMSPQVLKEISSQCNSK